MIQHKSTDQNLKGYDDMYYLACCDNDGRCFGFLRTDNTVSKNPDKEIDKLICFKKKSEASEKVMKINLSHSLLPNGFPFRVTVVKGQKRKQKIKTDGN